MPICIGMTGRNDRGTVNHSDGRYKLAQTVPRAFVNATYSQRSRFRYAVTVGCLTRYGTPPHFVTMRNFSDLTEREILALAIANEESNT